MSVTELKTKKGQFKKDPRGIWHYLPAGFSALGPLLEDALVNRPAGPVYFWFEQYPVPIEAKDTVETLHSRFVEWKEDYQATQEPARKASLQDLRKTFASLSS